MVELVLLLLILLVFVSCLRRDKVEQFDQKGI